MSDSDDSDYIVEHFVKPDKIGAPLVNDESADILGNFDDKKRKNIEDNVDEEENPSEDSVDSSDNDEYEYANNDDDKSDIDDDTAVDIANNKKKKVFDETDSQPEPKRIKKSEFKEEFNKKYDGKIDVDQINTLRRGASKANRYVLYVTNLNFSTSNERLSEYFSSAGSVKAVRIPKKRKGGFAFVEMADVDGFKVH